MATKEFEQIESYQLYVYDTSPIMNIIPTVPTKYSQRPVFKVGKRKHFSTQEFDCY